MIEHVILEALTRAKAFADLGDWRKICVTGRDSLEWLDELLTARVSALSPGPGSDIVCMREDHDRLSRSLQKSFALANPDDLEAWRIGAGRPRMGIDAFEGDLPQEAGLMDAVDFGKGQFLGREALAAIDASTPLRSVVVAVETSEPVSPGEQLYV